MLTSPFFTRTAILAAVWLLGTSTLSIAGTDSTPPAPVPQAPAVSQPEAAAAPAEVPKTPLVVPDVSDQPYVFAKGILEDAGFAWKVVGPVEGFPANKVVSQSPKPGTRVADTGAPLVELRLARNGAYEQRGLAKPTSPYAGTKVVEWEPERKPGPAPPPPAADPAPAAPTPAPGVTEPAGPDTAPPADPNAVVPPAPSTGPAPAPEVIPAASVKAPKAAKPAKPGAARTAAKSKAKATRAKASSRVKSARASGPARRAPAFVLPGAPAEPLDEIPLDERARKLQRRIAAAPKPTEELVAHWIYQHNWVVAGARFGWSNGAEALKILIAVDRAMQRRWKMGGRSERTARQALAFVQSKTG